MTDEYDLIVIGAGPVGENIADRAVQGGLSAVVVEHELVGGECSYWACMPSKALLRSPMALRAARHVAGSAEAVTGEIDVAAVLRRRDSFAASWQDDGQVHWLHDAGIDLVRGYGRVDGDRAVTVTASDGSVRTLTARHAVAIATGSAAVVPDIPGLRNAEPWTSREATSIREIPASIVIVGGGVVAVELATAFASLGAEATVLARSGLLGGFEPFAGELVAEGLDDLGVHVITEAAIERVERDADGVIVHTNRGVFRGAEILVATGREPRSKDLGLATIGLEPEALSNTDASLLVAGTDWLYAVGDVNGRAPLTHQGKYQARAAGDAIAARAQGSAAQTGLWQRHAATADDEAVPQVVFSQPEVAAVGLTEARAAKLGRQVRAVDVDLGAVAGAALSEDGYHGRARLVIDDDQGTVVGATLVGPDVAELIHAATIAVVGAVPLHRLWHAVPAYPTISEVWLRLLEAAGRDTADTGA